MINGFEINGAEINGAGNAADAVEQVRDSAAVVTGAHSIPLIRSSYLRDTAVITGDYVAPLIVGHTERDSAVVVSAPTDTRLARYTLKDPAHVFANYFATRVVSYDVSETAVVFDATTQSNPLNDVTDAAVVTGGGQYSLVRALTVRDSAVVLGYAATGISARLRETAVVVSYFNKAYRTARVAVTDDAVITGTHNTGALTRALDVTEAAVVTSQATSVLTARLIAHEEAYLSDATTGVGGIVGSDGFPAGTVWTTSVYSWGMSRHSADGITQRGVRFAVSPAGLFEVGASYSDAEMDIGFTSLDDARLKRVEALYLSGSRDGALGVTVTADDHSGQRVISSYSPIDRAQVDPRTIRVDIGRGYRSTYYRFQLNTTGRVELFSGQALSNPTQRRI